MLLPPSLEDMIEANHPVRVVNGIIDGINLDKLIATYKGGGTSSHHPRMLLKVLVYGYLSNIYSSRRLEEALKQNIHFMWLSGMSTPDHNTINRFRSERLKNQIKDIFTQIVLLLEAEGIVSLKTIFTDGTKIEANANRYTFVWGRAIERSKERIKEQLEDLWKYTQSVAKSEKRDTTPIEFKEIAPETVKETLQKIENALEGKEVDKKVKQKLNYAKKNWPSNLEKYKKQEGTLGERNSFSKTDPDATFMRMKEDHMKNGQLKPGYNVQISTNDQFILNYSIHQDPTDPRTLTPHIEQFNELYQHYPKELVADAGYGSQENYEYLNGKGIVPYVKYNQFDREQSGQVKDTEFIYNEEDDTYYCPQGRPLHKVGQKITSRKGKKTELEVYRTVSCTGCPLKDVCCKFSFKKLVKNERLKRLRRQVSDLLTSKRGTTLRNKRGPDVETVFAQIKHNKGFKRFMLRGREKVSIEFGLLSIAQNLRKVKVAA